MAAADDGGAKPREFALARVGKSAKQRLSYYKTKDGVAEELKLLVVRFSSGEVFAIRFVCEGTVRKRAF